jgi:hypothetical protein
MNQYVVLILNPLTCFTWACNNWRAQQFSPDLLYKDAHATSITFDTWKTVGMFFNPYCTREVFTQ